MTLVLYALGAVGVGASLKKASARLQLSKAKHPSLRGHARMSRLIAKLVPFSGEEASDEELLLVAAGKMRLPTGPLDIDELLSIPTGRVSGNRAIQALLDERNEGL